MNRAASNYAAKVTSVALRPEVKDVVEELSLERYGPRGFSRWTEERLGELLNHRSFLVRYAQSDLSGDTVRKSLRLTPASEKLLEQAVLRIRQLDPLSQNEQSRILRAAFDLAVENASQKSSAKEAKKSKPAAEMPDIPLEKKPRLGTVRAKKKR